MINIAVINNKYYEILYSNKEYIKENNIRIIPVNDEEALDLLMSSRVDMALITPLAYGSAVGKCDLRILNTKLCMAENFSDSVSIYFKENLNEINTATFPKYDNFVSNIAQIILKEKYELFPKPTFEDKLSTDFTSDILVSWENNENYKNKINLTEEWFDNFFNPLPMALWVAKAEESTEKLKEISENLFKSEKKEKEFYIEKPFGKDSYIQEGKVYWDWDNEFKNVIDNTLQILYFHQLFPELPEVKFYEGE